MRFIARIIAARKNSPPARLIQAILFLASAVAVEIESRDGKTLFSGARTVFAQAGAPGSSASAILPDEARVRFQRRGGQALVETVVNGAILSSFAFDTGLAHSTISPAVASRLGIDIKKLPVTTIDTAAGSIQAPFVILRSVEIGRLKVERVAAVVRDFSPDPSVQGILGLNVLRDFQVEIDEANGLLILSRTQAGEASAQAEKAPREKPAQERAYQAKAPEEKAPQEKAAPDKSGPAAEEMPSSTPSLQAEKPEWKVGYVWKYAWKALGRNGTTTTEMVREDRVGDVSAYVLKTGNEENFYTREALGLIATMDNGKMLLMRNPPDARFSWPLVVGKEWRSQYHLDRLQEKTAADFDYRLVVSGIEQIDVPAGSLETFKIDLYSGERLAVEYWYAPKAKWFAKMRLHPSDGVREFELVNFKVD